MLNKILIILLSNFAKFLAFLSRVTKKGSGTSLPGILVEDKFKFILKEITKGYSKKIFISGTNGKTTTRALLVDIYEKNDVKICTNRGGANIYRGLASSILLDLGFWGKPRSEVLILEVEEATLPILSEFVKPDILVLTNVFRDQLDAYGEIDKTLEYFEKSLSQSNPVVYVNMDDEKLLSCLGGYSGKVYGFSLDPKISKPDFEKSDKTKINFDKSFEAKNYKESFSQQVFEVFYREKLIGKVKTLLPGGYNVYNVLAAFLVALEDFDSESSIKPISKFSPVFGRGEFVMLNNNEINLFLVKNPAGFNQVLKYINRLYNDRGVQLAVLVNDNIADGKDVSWLWDIELEDFVSKQKISDLYTSGERGLDMLLRFEYADYKVDLGNHYKQVSDFVIKMANIKGRTIILCTYTALLELRKEIGKIVDVGDIGDSGN